METANLTHIDPTLQQKRGVSRGSVEQRRFQIFNNLGPTQLRSKKSCTNRWNTMVVTFKHINDYSSGRLNGSTGGEDWWNLTKVQRRASLGDKVFQI